VPSDQDHLARRSSPNRTFRARAVARRIGFEERGVEHGELRLEIIGLGGAANEEILREQILPRVGRQHAHRQAVARISPDVAIERVDILAGEVVADASSSASNFSGAIGRFMPNRYAFRCRAL